MKRYTWNWILNAAFLAVCLPIFLFSKTAYAEESRVYDDASLLKTAEEQELEQRISELRTSFPFDIVIVTTADTKGKSSQEYADDYYDSHSFGKGEDASGVLFLIDMDNREIYISTCGNAILFLTDSRIESILDYTYSSVRQQEYHEAVSRFLSNLERYVDLGIPDDQYQYNTDTGEIIRHYSLKTGEILFSVILALLAGGIPCLIILGRYSMRTGTYKYPYREKSRLQLTRREDIFRNQIITQRHIPPPETHSGGSGHSSGGSRSTTHHSSSGRTHGGGGRKF